MSRQNKIDNFNPNGVGVHNDQFIGLPFDRDEAQVILLNAPWDLTVSSGIGTHLGPVNILESSYQLDFYDDFVKDAWKMGIYMEPLDQVILDQNKQLRPSAENYIASLENGHEISAELKDELRKINLACDEMLQKLQEKCELVLNNNQRFGIIGGDHSVALAGIRACAKKYPKFGILQIDAHMDLRKSYEGFTYSHASIFYNAMQVSEIKKLVQVGVRDYCQEEINFANENVKRIQVYTDSMIQEPIFQGRTYDDMCSEIIDKLPSEVYVSFDIDGLMPHYCPNTGTPVPGGLTFAQAKYLIKKLVLSGRKIIGFDLCEVAGKGHTFDGNVGARIAYLLCNYMGKSQELT